jgi:PII-like signaling protein
MRSEKILRISSDLPIVIQIVDKAAKIHAFLPVLDAMMRRSGYPGAGPCASVGPKEISSKLR